MMKLNWDNPITTQEKQFLVCRSMMADEPIISLTVKERINEPLEKTRFFGPFDVEVVGFIMKLGNLAVMGWDADGKQYVEF